MADRNGMAIREDRTRHAEPPPLVLGQPTQAPPHRLSRLRLPPQSPRSPPQAPPRHPSPALLPQNRKAEPGFPDSALSSPYGPELPLALHRFTFSGASEPEVAQ